MAYGYGYGYPLKTAAGGGTPLPPLPPLPASLINDIDMRFDVTISDTDKIDNVLDQVGVYTMETVTSIARPVYLASGIDGNPAAVFNWGIPHVMRIINLPATPPYCMVIVYRLTEIASNANRTVFSSENSHRPNYEANGVSAFTHRHRNQATQFAISPGGSLSLGMFMANVDITPNGFTLFNTSNQAWNYDISPRDGNLYIGTTRDTTNPGPVEFYRFLTFSNSLTSQEKDDVTARLQIEYPSLVL